MSWHDSLRTRLRLLLAGGAAESRVEEEIRFHIDMEAERLERDEGLDAVEARRRAYVAFGGVERTKEAMRDGRGLAWLSGLRLDVKLGARMLLKYPVLTVASVLTLAIAVAMSASWFEFSSYMGRPDLPFAGGDRFVVVRNLDAAAASAEPRSLHDYEAWRDEVASIEHLTAASAIEFTVTTEDGRFGAIEGMRVTPSMFRLTGVQPLLGRVLTDADVEAAAPPVAVLSHATWQRLFDGDSAVVGGTLRLGAEHATIIGVMPPGYEFPLNEEIWVPLRDRAIGYDRRSGPRISVTGRLAPGASLEEAQAELAVIGQRMAADFPDTHEHLRPQVRRFGSGNEEALVASLLNIPFLLFLVVVSVNVATLLFARTATRESEIALRSALGASRRRIILQLVAEALVLTTAAAALGLAAAHWGLEWGMELFWEVQEMRPPFWIGSGISGASILYAAGLAVVAALIIGAIPGLRATRRQLRERLPQPGAGGAGMRFGTIATGVIVLQVALCVAFIPLAIMRGHALLDGTAPSDFPAASYLSGRLVLQEPGGDGATATQVAGADADPAEARPGAAYDEARRRLAAEPGVLAVTRTSRLPGLNHPIQPVQIEADSVRTISARSVGVDADFFDVVGARVTSGRGVPDAESPGAFDGVVVDQAWAATVFGGANPVGRRIRYPNSEGAGGARWFEIVGVVAGVERAIGPGTSVAIFHALDVAELRSLNLYIRTEGDPEAILPRLHTLLTSIDPRLGVAELKPLDDVWRPVERSSVFFAIALAVVAAIILMFALIGIYALMWFTVTQRAREIGIRAALGAEPRRILTAIFSRAMTQIGIGVAAGAVLVSLTVADDPASLWMVAGVAAAIIAAGLIGCALPARRALRIQPTEALRAE